LKHGSAIPRRFEPSGYASRKTIAGTLSTSSLVDGVGSGELSRVKMNALRAPLTALSSREDKCVFDEADGFIDVCAAKVYSGLGADIVMQSFR
jgi:hypothetical protein